MRNTITKKAQVDSMELAEKKQLAGGETVYPRMDKLKELIPALEEDSKLQRLMNKPNFGRLYAYELEKLNQTQQTKSTTSIDGEWIKFPQGSDHMLLVKAIEDHATGWCTANSSMAEDQLDKGDFHIFFSRDSQGQATIPRIAICMTGEIIAEVRGIAADQNMEAACVDIVAEKLETIPGGHEYQKNIESSKKLDLLEEKIAAGLELDQVDLKFLYEIDGPIAGFGQSDDSRINQIRKTRDVKRDLALVDNLERGEVALSLLDIKPDTRIYYNLASLDADPDANGDKGFRYSRNQYSEGLFKQQIQLNNIFARVNAGERLTADDLLLIYEINGPVVSLGIDPELENPQTIIERYPEIFERRNFLADMFEIKSAYPDLITKIDELMMDHYGELDIGHTESEDILAKLSKKESAGYIYTDSLQIEKLSPGDIFTDLLALEDLEIQGVLHLLGLQYDFDLAAGLIVQDRLDASGSCIQAIGPRTQVSGILDLSSSSIKSLPADIEVSTIDISGSKITELPAGLKLSTLIVRESQIKELPLDIEIKESIFLDPHLYLTEIAREDSPLRNIPRIEMTGDLDLRSAPKPFLPKIVLAIYIEGDLDLTDVGITELPQDSIEVENGSIYLSGNPVSQLPKTIIVGQDLALDYTQITELPENLEVPGDLNLEGTPISILPKGLKVGGDLYIGDTLITDLPDDLEVAGEIIRE